MLSKSCTDHAMAPIRNLSCLYIYRHSLPCMPLYLLQKVPRHAKDPALQTKKLTSFAPA
jgi:hypothetical protein